MISGLSYQTGQECYKPDITIGENPVIRGHWRDRLPAIEKDIAFMTGLVEQIPSDTGKRKDMIIMAVEEAMGRPVRTNVYIKHSQPEGYRAGDTIDIIISPEGKPSSVLMHYRHVNHAERFETSEMIFKGAGYQATIPAAYTSSEYPIQYYFELKDETGKAWLYPGFTTELDNQPYYLLRQI